jgi:hypothetical protein
MARINSKHQEFFSGLSLFFSQLSSGELKEDLKGNLPSPYPILEESNENADLLFSDDALQQLSEELVHTLYNIVDPSNETI